MPPTPNTQTRPYRPVGKTDGVWAFGLAAHTIGVLALAIAHNVKETIEIEETQTDKPVPPASPKHFEPTRRNILADSLAARAPLSLPTHPEPPTAAR